MGKYYPNSRLANQNTFWLRINRLLLTLRGSCVIITTIMRFPNSPPEFGALRIACPSARPIQAKVSHCCYRYVSMLHIHSSL